MIITKEVKINSHTRYKKYYEDLGYISINKEFTINVDDLPTQSHIIVDCLCDVCSGISHISYSRYIKNIEKYNLYTCSHKCANIKRKMTCNKIYGCDNAFQNDNIKDKIKDTLNIKYGVDHPMYSEEIKNKLKNTNLEKLVLN